MKSWLEKNDIGMYSTHKEGKSVTGHRFIRILKNEIYEYVYIDALDDIVNKYKPCHSTTKMKAVDVKLSTY